MSKSAAPGVALLATPLIAVVVRGRLIAGSALPLLLAADLIAIRWFGRTARSDVLRPPVGPVIVGFALGAWFYFSINLAKIPFDVAIGE